MFFSRKRLGARKARPKYSSIAVLALALSAFSCSTSPPAGEGNADGALPAPESNADQVGSIPEDMLADEKGVESSAGTAATDPAGADPFSDLAEKTEAPAADSSGSDRDALLVPEDTKGSSSGEPFADLDAGAGGSSRDSGGSGKMDRYVVKPGDTLMKIAFHLYGDVERWKDLQELNSAALKNGDLVRAGMKLRYEVPNENFTPDQHAKSYEIKKGDTLASIADEVYGRRAKYRKLQGYNKDLIKNPNRIFAGFTIFYDITEQEIAEAEARRAQRAAQGGGSVPSALNPPAPAPSPNVAVTPQATDNSAVQGPQSGPPSPGQ